MMSEEKEKIKYSKEEIAKMKCEIANLDKGTLRYFDCKKCLNKGFVFYLDNNLKLSAKQCDCMKTRKLNSNLENCGINCKQFEDFSFSNYEIKNHWQRKIVETAKKYLESDFKNWFVISGQSGIGKTHICTSILKTMIQKGYVGKYMSWINEVAKLKVLRKSVVLESQQEYEKMIKQLYEVDVLYIDDFLKLLNKKNSIEELEIAYSIIDSRNSNKKITIISTELLKLDMENLDVAITGRINEMAKEYWLQLSYEPDRNYRLKKEIDQNGN